MAEVAFNVKQSKKIFIAACCSAVIFIAFFLGLTVFFVTKLFDLELTNDEYILCVISLISSLVFAVVVLIILIYIIHNYRRQVDVYTEDKVYRKKGKSIIFEIPYNQIDTVREGFNSIFLVLHKGIVKKNGKKGPRNFYEHYAEKDIYEIERIISSYQKYNM